MRTTALAGLFLCAFIFTYDSPKVSAETPDPIQFATTINKVNELALQEVTQPPKKPKAQEKPIVHTVKDNETLIDIAKTYETTWQRLFFKNKQIEHPDQIDIGDKLEIPKADEVLPERELPEPEAAEENLAAEVPAQGTTHPAANTYDNPAYTAPRGSTAGNLYTEGYCTWYVKNRRPDLPNNLGDADTWLSRARAQGYATGSTPQAGAVAWAVSGFMHVAYVERVNGDGSVLVSEMNYAGWYVTSSRTVPASSFLYIY